MYAMWELYQIEGFMFNESPANYWARKEAEIADHEKPEPGEIQVRKTLGGLYTHQKVGMCVMYVWKSYNGSYKQ